MLDYERLSDLECHLEREICGIRNDESRLAMHALAHT